MAEQKDMVFEYTKLIVENVSIWSLIGLGVLGWLLWRPERLARIPEYVKSLSAGGIQIELRELREKLQETESQVQELEAENTKLSTLYAGFDTDAPVAELSATRDALKAVATKMVDTQPVLQGLKQGADPKDFYAAAEILRTRRDPAMLDVMLDTVERLTQHAKLENLRYYYVWTLTSALHRTILAAVKHTDVPLLCVAQLERAKRVIEALKEHKHVKKDRPDSPMDGISGPASYALNWIDKGLKKHRK